MGQGPLLCLSRGLGSPSQGRQLEAVLCSHSRLSLVEPFSPHSRMTDRYKVLTGLGVAGEISFALLTVDF